MEIRHSDIAEILKKFDSIDDISKLKSDMSFEDMGMDSLDQMNLFLELEEKFSIKIADEIFDQLKNIDDIQSYFKKI